jgi:hypothetical protein
VTAVLLTGAGDAEAKADGSQVAVRVDRRVRSAVDFRADVPSAGLAPVADEVEHCLADLVNSLASAVTKGIAVLAVPCWQR